MAERFRMADHRLTSILSSIDRVQVLVADPSTLALNRNQCASLNRGLQEAARFLQREDVRTRIHDASMNIGPSKLKASVALTHLDSVVKRAENLVQQCCRSNAWPKGALTLFAVEYDVLDILNHLWWWMSVLRMVMDVPSSKLTAVERVQLLNQEFELKSLSFDKLKLAAEDDKRELLNKVTVELQARNGESPDTAHLLLLQLYALLTDQDEHSNPQLNNFTYSRLLGHGAFGVVHKVKWCGYDCVLKQYWNGEGDDVEVKSLKRLQHPHIVRFLRHWKIEGSEYDNSHILMEGMERDLQNHINNEKRRTGDTRPFPLAVAIDIMLQVMSAVWHMHERHIVHRDLKPKNVLVRKSALLPEGYVEVKLRNFATAKMDMYTSIEGELTFKAGTSHYRAPELSSRAYTQGASRKLPHRIDMWSFSIMCSHILTGLPPFSGLEGSVLHEHIVNGRRPSLPDDCPGYLRYCIESCWELKPENRPRASDMWRMLRIAQLRILGLVDDGCDSLFRLKDHSKKQTLQLPPSIMETLQISYKMLHPSQGAMAERDTMAVTSEVATAKRDTMAVTSQVAMAERDTLTVTSQVAMAECDTMTVTSQVAMAERFTVVDKLTSIQASIDRVQVLVEDPSTLALNKNQCAFLSRGLEAAGQVLQREDVRTRIHGASMNIGSSESKASAVLIQLDSVIKRAETLVQRCCRSNAWPKGALTLFAIKYDVLDIFMDLQWWISVGTTVMPVPCSELATLAVEGVQNMKEFFEHLLKTPDELEEAAENDKRELLNKVKVEIQSRNDNSCDTAHLLLLQLHSLLTDQVEHSTPQLNVYTHDRFLGTGSFGVVDKVKWCGYDCVHKQYRNPKADDVEVESLKSLHHPQIVRFLRHWKSENTEDESTENYNCHILMEEMERDLEVHISREKRRTGDARPFSLPVAIHIMLQVISAVWHMHERHIVHRDLKPKNVLVRKSASLPEGYVEVKLGDFGIAKMDMDTSNAGALTFQLGTLQYRAPELSCREYTQGASRNSPLRIDMWSFGIMCSTILTGLSPFSEVEGNLQEHIKKGGRPSLPDDCPRYLRFCIESCWELKPENRPRASDMWRMLRLAQLRILGLVDDSCDSLFSFKDHSNK